MGVSLFFAAMAQTSEGIKSAGQKKTDLRIGDKPLFNARRQLLADVSARFLKAVAADSVRLGNIAVADEFAALVIMTGREGQNPVRKSDQVFGFACK